MPLVVNVSDSLALTDETQVVDVRSPAEFLQGHLPGALNIPLFDNRERAEIGTLYTRQGREQAILRGLDIILPKTKYLLKSLSEKIPGNTILVYCWRGGMRSSNMGMLFEQAGYRVRVLRGGYKAYRTWIRHQLDRESRIVILGGYTGSGKTEILSHLEQLGEQVIDLEGLASHKGSAFGGIGLPDQPTNDQFENALFHLWRKLDHSRFVWLEDESRMIGKVTMPDPVIRKIQQSPMVILEVAKEIRVKRLVKEYASFDDTLLSEAVMKIEERLGRPRAREALVAIREKKYADVAENVLIYYDKAYAFAIGRRDGQPRYSFPVKRFDPAVIAAGLIRFVQKHLKNGSHLPGL
ncbi:MAG: tRNA 2-selenouridine(34) synthase MnmH [bacterium]